MDDQVRETAAIIKNPDDPTGEDPDFPVVDQPGVCLWLKDNGLVSRDPDPTVPEPASWQRLSRLGGKRLFSGGSAPGDVIQGGCGTCYFLGAVMALSTRHSCVSSA